MAGPDNDFDRAPAVTRSLLGWGGAAGVFYLTVGVAQGVTRVGFSFTEHALSLLMLGEGGWVQSANLIISGAMVLAAGGGFVRAMAPEKGARAAGVLLGVYGAALIGSGIFPPDPVDGFPDPGSTAEATANGLIHLGLGGVGFLALSAAAFVVAGWLSGRGDSGAAIGSRVAGSVVLIGFLGGAALSAGSTGVALLWIAVITGWAWLAIASIRLYRTVPHPELRERTAPV